MAVGIAGGSGRGTGGRQEFLDDHDETTQFSSCQAAEDLPHMLSQAARLDLKEWNAELDLDLEECRAEHVYA